MHEYSLMQQVIEEIEAQLEGRDDIPAGRIAQVRLTVGQLDIHTEEAFRQAFESLIQNTRLEGAALALTVVPATLACTVCDWREEAAEGRIDSHDPSPFVECPRCGAPGEVLGGRGIREIELTVDEGAGAGG